MTTVSQLLGDAVNVAVRVQSGSVGATTPPLGPAYLEVTIAPVADITRCVVFFEGGSASPGFSGAAMARIFGNSDTGKAGLCVAALMDTSTLRISATTGNGSSISGRWQILEYL